jgi:excisionase family DNA binding protein
MKDDVLVANSNLTPSHELLERQAFEAFKAFVTAFQRLIDAPSANPDAAAISTSAERDVMTADDVAAFLGVDRNTVYEFAARGVIPHQRLGKRFLFRRGAIVAWLDARWSANALESSRVA